jgi:hypothetical protein
MTIGSLQHLARRFERRCLRPLLRRDSRRPKTDGHDEAAARIESRLDLLERLLRESLGLQYVALRDAADPHSRAEPPLPASVPRRIGASCDASPPC